MRPQKAQPQAGSKGIERQIRKVGLVHGGKHTAGSGNCMVRVVDIKRVWTCCLQQAAEGKERCEKWRVLASGVRYDGIGSWPRVHGQWGSPFRKLLWRAVTVHAVTGGCLVVMTDGDFVNGVP